MGKGCAARRGLSWGDLLQGAAQELPAFSLTSPSAFHPHQWLCCLERLQILKGWWEVCPPLPGHTDPTTNYCLVWGSASPASSTPAFFWGLVAGGLRKPCSDVEIVILGGSGERNYSQHCREKMALEGFLRVGGVWHFLPSCFHKGTQAWPVSGTPGVAACLSSGAPSGVALAPWVR